MTYLDYSATTPMSLDAIDAFVKINKEYIGSTTENNIISNKNKKLLEDTTKEIGDMFNILPNEIIYTASGVEANNMALIGVAMANHKRGKHIITSKLEHPSIYAITKYLESVGFEISYVDNDEDGLVIFDDLKNLIREDTILVSISAVNYETGVRQPLKMLRQIIKKENPFTLFHSDLSQAIGKMAINFRDVDLGSISAHKFYGPRGIGFLFKNNLVKIAPLLYGSKNIYIPNDNISLPLIVSMKEALKNSLKDLDKKERYVTLLNERIVSKLEKLSVYINKTKYSIPYILNIGLDNISSEELSNSLAKKDIFVSSSQNNESIKAIYKDIRRSKNTIRISLSYLTTVLEINRFLEDFEVEYNKLGG